MNYFVWLLIMTTPGQPATIIDTVYSADKCEVAAHEYRIANPGRQYKCTPLKTATDWSKKPVKPNGG